MPLWKIKNKKIDKFIGFKSFELNIVLPSLFFSPSKNYQLESPQDIIYLLPIKFHEKCTSDKSKILLKSTIIIEYII